MPSKISEIYEQQQIMPALREHQYRVAAVAYLLAANVANFDEGMTVVAACLLHDMGNILKFDLEKFPEFLVPEGFDYWEKVQTETRETYGSDEHAASVAMAREIGVSERVLELIEAVGFSNATENQESGDTAKQICAYADMRVGPYGVLSLQDRLDDLKIRYEHKPQISTDDETWEIFANALLAIEEKLFEEMTIPSPGDITDQTIRPIMLQLSDFMIGK